MTQSPNKVNEKAPPVRGEAGSGRAIHAGEPLQTVPGWPLACSLYRALPLVREEGTVTRSTGTLFRRENNLINPATLQAWAMQPFGR